MNKEPIGLYIFRFVLGLGLFCFMCMLYWSSTLIEEDLKNIRSEVSLLKSDLSLLRSQSEKERGNFLEALIKQQNQWQEVIRKGVICANIAAESIPELKIERTESWPNLLHEDPFFLKTLPKLLGAKFTPTGTQHTATVGKPNNLHPFTNWSQVSAWHDLCSVSLARMEFGKYETLSPEMALRIEERVDPKNGIPEFWVHLRDDVFWQPLKPEWFSSATQLAPQFLRKNQVTADDYKFYLDAIMNPYVQEPGAVSLRTYYDGILEVIVVDKFTFIVRWKTKQVIGSDGKPRNKIKFIAKQLTANLKPLPSFVYKYFIDGKKIIEDDNQEDSYRKNSVWAQNFAQHWAKNIIVSCGPWVFEGMNERQIRFKRNEDFYFGDFALTRSIEVDFKESPDNIWQEFKNNRLDSYALQPEQLAEYNEFIQSKSYDEQKKKDAAIKRLDYIARSYMYVGWNQTKPFFKNAAIRRALTMAIDRKRIIENNLNGLGIEITGPFYRFSPSYDVKIQPLPFDPIMARHLLEKEGWSDTDGDGIVDKIIEGKRTPFRFSLTYYVKNPLTKSICEYISTALKDISIECHLNGVDVADLSATFDDKSFDALCLGWSLGNPPDDPRQLWHSSGAKEKGSSNAIGFANSQIDKIIDQLDYEYDLEKRIALYHLFDKIIHEEQPYTFLYTPKTALLYREYLQNVWIPADRQDLIPGANVGEPDSSIFWLKNGSY